MILSSGPSLPNESEAADKTFNEDADSLILNTTSHSKVSNVNKLIVFLNHQASEGNQGNMRTFWDRFQPFKRS